MYLYLGFPLSVFTLLTNGAHTETAATVVVSPVVIITAEVQEASSIAVAVKRRRPVATIATYAAAGSLPVAIARSGEEDAITVGAGHFVTVYTIEFSPLPCTVVE